MKAAIIIPHYKDVERLERCLKALQPQVSTPELAGQIDVVVADNNSGIDLSELAKRYPPTRVVVETTKGAAAARNCGVRETTAPLLFFIDADCLPADDWVATALRLMEAAPPDSLIGGQVGTFDETAPPRNGAQAFETVFAFDQRSYIEKKDFSGTGNLLTHRNTFNKVGPLQEDGVAEDMEWSRRALSLGCSLTYAHDLVATHPTRNDWAALRKKWLRTTQETYLLHRDAGGSAISWVVRAAAVTISPFAHVHRLWTSPKIDGFGERARATATLFRLRWTRVIWMLRQASGIGLPQ